MAQSTLDDEDLFGEAASEVRADVEEHLDAAEAGLPDADEIWDVDADNTLGALNALRSALDAGDATEHLRDAKKWYTMGDRADAFEDGADLAERIESVAALVESVEDAREQVGDLASTIPELRSDLEALSGDDGAEPEADADAGSEAEA